MDKRQQIILGALAIVVVFAASEHLPGVLSGGAFGGAQVHAQVASREAETVAQSLRTTLGDAELGRDVDRMVTLVAREWSGDRKSVV